MKSGIIYNVELARNEAFKDTPLKINIRNFSEFFIDENHKENLEAARSGKRVYKGKKLPFFRMVIIPFNIKMINIMYTIMDMMAT